jgi:integrase
MKPIPFASETTPWRVRVPANFSPTGRVQMKYFRTKSAALDFIAKLTNERAQFGNQAVTPEEHAAITHARHLLKVPALDSSLMNEIVTHWLKTGTGAVTKRRLFEAVDEYIAWAEGQPKKFSKRTLSDIRWRMRDFSNFAADDPVHQIGEKEIQLYLDKKTEGWTRRSFFKRLRPFFRWARSQRIIATNPMEQMAAPSIGYHAPEVYTPDELRDILDHCEQTGSVDMLPYVVLSAFGFLRQAELVRERREDQVLQWEHVQLDRERIWVPHGIAKRTNRDLGDERFIPIIPALRHWLEPVARKTGQVVPWTHRKFYQRLAEIIDGSGVEAVNNGLRHSCISYFLAANSETAIGTAARYAGNSEGTTRKHYLRVLSKEQGEAWFAIRRAE